MQQNPHHKKVRFWQELGMFEEVWEGGLDGMKARNIHASVRRDALSPPAASAEQRRKLGLLPERRAVGT